MCFARWQSEHCGAGCWFRLACASCWPPSSTAVGDPQRRQNYITPHFAKCPPVSRGAPFVAATASRPAGLQKRRYAKLPTLKRARQPPALPSRFASYVQSPVALVVCWHLGISQALRAWFWSAASPVILCLPPPTPGACLLRSFARAVCPSAPRGGSLRTAPRHAAWRRRHAGVVFELVFNCYFAILFIAACACFIWSIGINC